MKKHKLICYAIIAATIQSIMAAPARQWSPEQATGAPNTPTAGDLPTAWASLHPDGGTEWLQVEFDKPVEVAEVLIRETFNPGAISKVVAVVTGNKETTIWEGQAPTSAAPTEMVVKASSPVFSNKIKIYLDSNRVPGWNEIDAVQLVGKDGSRQWASIATASSSFAERPSTPQPVESIEAQIPAQQFNLQELLGNSLVDAQGKPVDPSTLKGKTIGLYFSAHWCGPCKAFTPKLVEFRNKIAKDFEVVFISSDRDETGMFNYMKESGTPWPALPFNSEKKGELNKLFQIKGIPSLIVLNDKGLRIAGNPINDVAALAPVAAFEKWKQNIVEPITIIPNSCSIQDPIRRVYEGEKVTPPKDLTIDPGKTIFGCTYGSTEKEVIDGQLLKQTDVSDIITPVEMFTHGFKHINQAGAESYLIASANVRKYSEWQNPPVTYWGPTTNDKNSSLTYKFTRPGQITGGSVVANLASFNFPWPGYAGAGKGSSSLWASRDGKSWTLLLDNPTPSDRVDSYKKFNAELPASVLGGRDLWIQVRMRTTQSPLSSYTTAQFSRSSTASIENIFEVNLKNENKINK